MLEGPEMVIEKWQIKYPSYLYFLKAHRIKLLNQMHGAARQKGNKIQYSDDCKRHI